MKRELFCIFIVITIVSSASKLSYRSYLANPSVKKLQEYIQIDTSQEKNIAVAVEFWKRQAAELNLPIAVYGTAGKPICVITVVGTDPTLPSIMLNTHMDVVPADKSEWTYPPFSAYMDENGDIYGRGMQDTKDVAIQYIEAVRKLQEENFKLKRTLHITLMPDEETGGYEGMKPFIETKEFESLNVGFAIDEGLTDPTNELFATYVDKRPFQPQFTFQGNSAHGSVMGDNTAIEKVEKFINIVMKYRDEQKKLMKSVNVRDVGAYTSVNINMIEGGVAPNIVPGNISVVVDMRLATDSNVSDVDALIQSWISEADNHNNTEIKYIRREEKSLSTQLDSSNPYWTAFQKAVDDMGYKVTPMVCPATSDMLYLRNRGIHAIGFSPKMNTIVRVHGKNEYQNVETFLRGIDIYVAIFKSIGNFSNTVDTKKKCF